MKLPDLIDLSFILILASKSNGQDWKINVPEKIDARLDGNVTISCNFTYPDQYGTDVKVFWKKRVLSSFDTNDKDKNAFIYHPNNSFVLENYRGKTELVGDASGKDCSLMIKGIMNSDRDIYVRIMVKDENYSFINDLVLIDVSGVTPVKINKSGIANQTETPSTFEATTIDPTQKLSTSKYMTIVVPVAALLITVFVAGIVFYVKRKRSQSFTREESGYYANFSRASSNPAKRSLLSFQTSILPKTRKQKTS
ncbi:uncharacterized protein LOC121946112 isoform X2 [Plectropomus leopardus]|uniref:uncharacterized protein LOC121946112 isoform X2 n=1 Tax=Plectropomus leopardus TaxID=160734 RepID=UPI001C4BECA9|nr:uncharacterized protein LOC121946112 isoform X2 [Plectropomus leopardus]